MPRRIGGNVHWIENGRSTDRVVDAKEAFGDPNQATEQVRYAEASGDARQLRLSRLAYRQYQGKRYRGPSKGGKVTKRSGKRESSVGKGKKRTGKKRN